ncbi:hypothetical protein N7492_001153 [Penicillium capsulatum]|uniref:J domain-containing protein n=1 Tax=Penicillium capsulatum TaxID=69766 RepID=A0A9W9IT98_9EURO|nr:hypothetical protein N7492_001153 [Penicillium capsulatum]KAJ6129791.1 hypothetical protein N7512_002571 [Penicillium capsulatum]
MSSPPDFDPYAVLGVSKEATLPEIRAAHRKRVLKCHPDKIQDESQRNAAQDEFQKVQQAYELLSDETRRTRYDQKARIADLKREVLERRRTESFNSSPRGSSSSAPREYRDGRIVEERVPVEVFLDEALRFTDEPRPMARKYDEYGMRTKSKTTEDKKKPRMPTSSYRAAKELRESTKATLSDQAKRRDRERRQQASEKHDNFSSFVESDEGASDSSGGLYYTRRPSRRPYESRESRTRPSESRRHRERAFDDDDYADHYARQESFAAEHIERSKYENEHRPRGSRSPQRHRGYDSPEPESSASRRSARSSRSARNHSSSRNNSYENLDSPRSYEFKPPKMPTASSSPGHKSSIRPSLFSSRTASASAFQRPKRDSSSRDEPSLSKMVHETIPPRSSKLRDRYDSTDSSPTTPEMPKRGSSPKVTARYTIDDPVIIKPSKSSKYRSISPERERVPRGMPKSSSTFAEQSPQIEVRSVRPQRAYGDVKYAPGIRGEDVKYTREIRPSDVNMSSGRHHYSDHYGRHPPAGRRQSATA